MLPPEAGETASAHTGTGRIGDRHHRSYWRQDTLATDAEADLLATQTPDLLATVWRGRRGERICCSEVKKVQKVSHTVHAIQDHYRHLIELSIPTSPFPGSSAVAFALPKLTARRT